MVEISMAPTEEDVRMIAKEYWLTLDWEFLDLHEELIKQLDECRRRQGPKAEPVNVPSPGEPTIEAQEPQ
eukprot:12933741-Prorocentrum_lima.AAC.1